jgi:hypothetical protein
MQMRHTHIAVTVLATLIALALGAAPALAGTGSVYVDAPQENVGAGAFQFNGTFTGQNNVGLGYFVMPDLTTGNGNIAVGNGALEHVTSGLRNVSTDGLFYNTTGSDNIASGFDSLLNNTSGDANIASGFFALSSNGSGNYNIASGYQALKNATGNSNIGVGHNAGINLTKGSRNVYIENPGVNGESGTIRIGNAADQDAAFIAGISGKTVSGPTKAVVVNAKGRLGTAPAPASPLKAQGHTTDRLRAANRAQRDRLRKQGTELRQMRGAIQRLRAQLGKSG